MCSCRGDTRGCECLALHSKGGFGLGEAGEGEMLLVTFLLCCRRAQSKSGCVRARSLCLQLWAARSKSLQIPPWDSCSAHLLSFLSFKRNIKAEVLYYMKLADIKGLLVNLTPLSTVLKVRTLQLGIDLVADVF